MQPGLLQPGFQHHRSNQLYSQMPHSYINVCVCVYVCACVFIIPILIKVFVYHLLFKISHSLSLNNDTFPLWRVVFIDSFFSSRRYARNIQWAPSATEPNSMPWPSVPSKIKSHTLSLALPLTTSFLWNLSHSSSFSICPISVCSFIQLVLRIDYLPCLIQGILLT